MSDAAPTRPTRRELPIPWREGPAASRWDAAAPAARGPVVSAGKGKRQVQGRFSGSVGGDRGPAGEGSAIMADAGWAASRPDPIRWAFVGGNRGVGLDFVRRRGYGRRLWPEYLAGTKKNIDVVDDDETEESWPFPS